MGCSPQWFGLSLTGARDCDGPAIIGATWVVVTPASIDEPKGQKVFVTSFNTLLRKGVKS